MRPLLDDQDIDTRHGGREVQMPAESDGIAAVVDSQRGEIWLGELLVLDLLLDEHGSGGGRDGARLEE